MKSKCCNAEVVNQHISMAKRVDSFNYSACSKCFEVINISNPKMRHVAEGNKEFLIFTIKQMGNKQ